MKTEKDKIRFGKARDQMKADGYEQKVVQIFYDEEFVGVLIKFNGRWDVSFLGVRFALQKDEFQAWQYVEDVLGSEDEEFGGHDLDPNQRCVMSLIKQYSAIIRQ